MKTSYIIISIFSGLVCLFTSCEKDTEPVNLAPRLEVAEALNVTRTSATIKGSIADFNNSTLEDFGFMYSTLASMPEEAVTKVQMRMQDTENGIFSADISGLTAGKTYYWCTYAHSGISVAKSEIKEFKTNETTVPVFEKYENGASLKVMEIGENSFKVQGRLLDDGGTGTMSLEILYYKSSEGQSTEKSIPILKNWEEDPTFELEITGLDDGCMYYVYPRADNGKEEEGTTTGTGIPVTTVKYEKAVLSIEESLEKITNRLARAKATILKGNHEIVESGFVYSYEISEPIIEAATKIIDMDPDGNISAEIPFEDNGMTYYVRAYAKDDKEGTSYSKTIKFVPSDFYDLDIIGTLNGKELDFDTPINADEEPVVKLTMTSSAPIQHLYIDIDRDLLFELNELKEIKEKIDIETATVVVDFATDGVQVKIEITDFGIGFDQILKGPAENLPYGEKVKGKQVVEFDFSQLVMLLTRNNNDIPKLGKEYDIKITLDNGKETPVEKPLKVIY